MDVSERVAVYSIITNGCLVLIKYSLAFLSGSIALVADAIHSLSDIVSSATVLFGIRISRRKSRAFPYGFYKVENLVSFSCPVKPEAAEAKYDNGLLKIEVPFKDPMEDAVKVPID